MQNLKKNASGIWTHLIFLTNDDKGRIYQNSWQILTEFLFEKTCKTQIF